MHQRIPRDSNGTSIDMIRQWTDIYDSIRLHNREECEQPTCVEVLRRLLEAAIGMDANMLLAVNR